MYCRSDIFLTSGSPISTAARYLRDFRFPGIRYLKAQLDWLGYFFVTSGSRHSVPTGTDGLARICLRHFRFPGIQRLKARVDFRIYVSSSLLVPRHSAPAGTGVYLVRHIFVTSGSQAFSACRHGCTCSDIGIYICHFRFQAFSACRHGWTCSDMSSSLPVPRHSVPTGTDGLARI